MKRMLVVAAMTLPGLLGLGVGGYFFLTNVVLRDAGNPGPDACKVATVALARRVLGESAQPIDHYQGSGFTICTYYGAGQFLKVEVGSWDIIQSNVTGSGRPNQGSGAGTYLLNTSTSQDATLASDSWLGRVGRKGDVGVFVTAGHYGQFFGARAIRELALEDRIERKAVTEVLPRL